MCQAHAPVLQVGNELWYAENEALRVSQLGNIGTPNLLAPGQDGVTLGQGKCLHSLHSTNKALQVTVLGLYHIPQPACNTHPCSQHTCNLYHHPSTQCTVRFNYMFRYFVSGHPPGLVCMGTQICTLSAYTNLTSQTTNT